MLRNPNIRNVVLARLISSAGFEASFFIGLWGKAAYEFGGDPTDLAILSALVGTGAIIGSLAGGTLVDRFDAQRVMAVMELVFVPATLLMVLADSMTKLLLFGIISWTAGGILETAIVSMPPSLVDDDDLETANASLESANWLAMIAGPAIGAVLAKIVSIDAVFVFDAATSAVAWLLVSRVTLREVEHDHEPEVTSVAPPGERASLISTLGLEETWDGLTYALSNKRVLLVMYLGGLTWLAFGVFIALEPLYYRDVLGVGVELIGYVNAVFGAGLFIGATVVARSKGRFSTLRWALVLSVLSGFGSAIYVGFGTITAVMIGAVAWAVPLGAALPVTRTIAQRATERSYQGRVMGAIGMVQSLTGLLPLAVAPALAAWLGVQAVLVMSGASIIVLAPLAWRRAAQLDAEASPVAPVGSIESVSVPVPGQP